MLKAIKHYLSCYKAYFKMNILVLGEYKIDFLAINMASVLVLVISIINIQIIFSQTDSLMGWSKDQVLWNLGYFYLVRAIFNTFFINALDIGYWIRTGKLDLYIIRPLNTFFQLLSTGRYNAELPLDEFVMGIGLLIISNDALAMPLSFNTVMWFVVFLLLSTAVYFLIMFLMSVTAFWSLKSNALREITENLERLIEYPITIYHNFIRFFVSFIFPFAFICYFPSTVFQMKNGAFEVLLYQTIIVVVLSTLCFLLWRKGMKIYQSVGS